MPYADPDDERAMQRRLREEKLQMMHAHLGGHCLVCGSQNELEIHHRDPKQKSFNPTQRWTKPWPAMAAELAKCELRCHEHHVQFHEAKHGTISRYTNNKCRCDECVAIYRKYDREKHQRHRDEAKRAAASVP